MAVSEPQSFAAASAPREAVAGVGDVDAEDDMDEVEEPEVQAPVVPAQLRDPGSVEEKYALAKHQADTFLQKVALERLKAMDEAQTACFTAKQALELTRALREAHAMDQPKTSKRRFWSGLWTCDCVVWVGIAVLLLLVPIVIAASGSRDVRAESSGVLLSVSKSLPMGVAPVMVTKPLAELTSLPEATLRRIRGCAFSHRSALHHIRVASLKRGSTGKVSISSPDGTTLSVEQEQNVSVATVSVSNFRPFVGESSFSVGSSADSSCTFALLTSAPDRARPPKSGSVADAARAGS